MNMSNTFTNVAGYQVTNPVNASNYVNLIIEFEGGELDDIDTIDLFQYLIDTGLAWSLQGSYGRTANALIELRHCFRANDLRRPNVVDANVIETKALPSGE
jgi:hypothetical protein